MNINFPNSTSPGSRADSQGVRRSGNGRPAQVAGNTAGQPAKGNSEVSLSDRNVTALAAQLANLPSVRQDRVEALQQAIHNGSYQVNSRQLADAIQADVFGPSDAGS
ncbi:MAG: flagellar biosynthesis anti-sigma factor FlgM [Acidobacteriota bacterium]